MKQGYRRKVDRYRTAYALKKFRGKLILKRLYQDHIQPLGFSYSVFVITLAKVVAKKPTLLEELCGIFKILKQPKKSLKTDTEVS